MFGLPIPMLTIETGILLYRPVTMKNPLSEVSLKALGSSSNKAARDSARD